MKGEQQLPETLVSSTVPVNVGRAGVWVPTNIAQCSRHVARDIIHW